MRQPHATLRSTTRGPGKAQAATLAARDVEQRLSAGEGALLLGALFALAASMASLMAL